MVGIGVEQVKLHFFNSKYLCEARKVQIELWAIYFTWMSMNKNFNSTIIKQLH